MYDMVLLKSTMELLGREHQNLGTKPNARKTEGWRGERAPAAPLQLGRRRGLYSVLTFKSNQLLGN
jgi:hypothetical protein